MKKRYVALAVTLTLISVAAQAGDTGSSSRVQAGSFGGLAYTARSTVIGQGSTGTIASGGVSDYLAQSSRYNGVVGLLLTYTGGQFVCSGSLLSDRRSIATAAHCVSEGNGTRAGDLLSTRALFFDGNVTNDPNVYSSEAAGVTGIDVAQYYVNSNYTGQVVDQNDIAVLTLSELAPNFATSYDLYDGNDLTGREFNVVGYGNRSTVGGAVGTDSDPPAGVGRRRQGDNVYDFSLGNDDFNGVFTDQIYRGPLETRQGYFGTADVRSVYLSDFDNGLSNNDSSCLLTSIIGVSGGKYCNTGLGVKEVGIAGGDSGGPGFINGQLASINSFGLSFGSGLGDVDDSLNSSWGEFNGYVPTYIHRNFILNAMASGVPEPATWIQLILGFGLVGGVQRKRHRHACA